MLTNATEDFVPQVMKLEDVTQANEEIDEAVHRSASAYRGTKRVVVSRTFKSGRLKRWLSVHDLQVGFQFDLQSARIVWFERERKSRRTQSRNQSKLFVIRTKIRMSMI